MTDYEIPGTNILIEKGTEVYIPLLALQMDEQYYDNPCQFDPDRFNGVNFAGNDQINRPYMPFGDGPRNCIGSRLGKMQTKVALVMMLQKFTYDLSDELKGNELKFNPKYFLLSPIDKIHLKVLKR